MNNLSLKSEFAGNAMRYYMILIVGLLFFSCSPKSGKKNDTTRSNQYARGFSITKSGAFKKIEIFNPWENADNIRFEYYLAGSDQVVPDTLKNKQVIRTPVKKVICMSTSHIAFLEAINETESISGVSGGHYVTSQKVRPAFEKGRIAEIGYGQNINYELIINIHPDLVMVYGIGSEVSGMVKKLQDLGVPVIIIAEYLEQSPLGKTEWLKLVASLFNKEEMAVDFFRKIETDYLALKEITRNQGQGPKVLVGVPYRDSWWVPGGNSYIANLIADAGGNYPGKENPDHESYVISFEDAMLWAETADVWINTGSLANRKEILDTDSRFANFGVFRKGTIFNNNRLVTPSGGNDFWESGTVYPNRILSDLIRIFHPGLLPERDFTYYKEIK